MTKTILSTWQGSNEDATTYYTKVKFDFTLADDGIEGSVTKDIPHPFPPAATFDETVTTGINNRGVSELRALITAKVIADKIAGTL